MTTSISNDNKLANMLNLEKCVSLIAKCPKDETVILIPHYSINVQSNEEVNHEFLDDDFREFESYLGCSLLVTDYDDLVADPHGIFANG